jgi:hypothetical protein
MTQLTEKEVICVLGNLPKEVVEVLKTLRVYLGGGFIRSVLNDEEPNDIDLFIQENIDAKLGVALLRDTYGVYSTDNAITLQKKGCKQVQFITRWNYRDAQEMIESFDFTVAMAGIWYDLVGQVWKSVRHVNYYHDVYNKELVYLQPDREEERAGSLLRMVKFLNKGYSINDKELSKVIGRSISKLPWLMCQETTAIGHIHDEILRVRTKSSGGISGIY